VITGILRVHHGKQEHNSQWRESYIGFRWKVQSPVPPKKGGKVRWYPWYTNILLHKAVLLACSALYCAVLHCPYSAVLYCTVLHCTILHCASVLYCTVVYCHLCSSKWRRRNSSFLAGGCPHH